MFGQISGPKRVKEKKNTLCAACKLRVATSFNMRQVKVVSVTKKRRTLRKAFLSFSNALELRFLKLETGPRMQSATMRIEREKKEKRVLHCHWSVFNVLIFYCFVCYYYFSDTVAASFKRKNKQTFVWRKVKICCAFETARSYLDAIYLSQNQCFNVHCQCDLFQS